MIVVDASVIGPFLIDGGLDGSRYRRRLRGEQLAAPDLLKVEVLSVIRRQRLRGRLTAVDADRGVSDLRDLPVRLYPTAPLLRRAWDLHPNITAYDACYVALAEALGCVLLTADRRLSRAPGMTTTTEIP